MPSHPAPPPALPLSQASLAPAHATSNACPVTFTIVELIGLLGSFADESPRLQHREWHVPSSDGAGAAFVCGVNYGY